MKLKLYYAITSNGKVHPIKARFYEEALKKSADKFGRWLISVVEADEIIDSEFLKLVTGKFKETALNQELKGLKKYGSPVNPMDDYDWLNMAEEEQIDGYKYLMAERVKRDTILKDVFAIFQQLKESLSQKQESFVYVKIIESVEQKLRKLSKNI